MKYQVGNLIHYREDDPEFDTLPEAEKYALELSYNDSPIGIWTDQQNGSKLLEIVYQQEIFRP